MESATTEPLTSDHLLGGRVKYVQPRAGLRASLDPVLLAASVPARAGERVLEGGTGAGAALLCLAARVAGIRGLGIDRDERLIPLARANAVSNGWPDLDFVVADLEASPTVGKASPAAGEASPAAWEASPVAGPVAGTFDHAFANPPYHAAAGTRSPSAARDAAMRSGPGQLAAWVNTLSRPLRHHGTLTLILPPTMLETALAAMRDANVPAACVFPVWPKAGKAARFVLVQGKKHGRAALVLAPGLVLHTEHGTFRPEADLILRDGAALHLTGR
jgi:tRNA1Val (adenine37-N6)-methyltransferase